jgi:hypothetical protein
MTTATELTRLETDFPRIAKTMIREVHAEQEAGWSHQKPPCDACRESADRLTIFLRTIAAEE